MGESDSTMPNSRPSTARPRARVTAYPLLALLAACTSAPQPTTIAPSTAPPPPDVSIIVVPIHASLKPLLPELEKNIPKSVAKLDGYELDPHKRFGMKYRVDRDPVELDMIGEGLHATTHVHYALEGCARTGSRMWPCISCGFGEPMRDAVIRLHSHFTWDQSWRLRSQTTAQPVEFPNKCGVTILNINIADWKLAPLVNEQLRDVAKTIDGNTPKMTNIRPMVQQTWTTLQSPIQLAPRTWLVLEPLSLSLGPIHGTGLDVTSTLILQTHTRVIVGEKPVIAAKPLPPLRTEGNPEAAGLRIPFNFELTYADASRLLTQQFAGKKFGDVTIESVKLAPSKEGRVAIEAMIAMKRYHGPVVLDGLPQFDTATSSLTIGDLEYELQPKHKSPFLRLADRISHEALRDQLRKNTRWNVTNELSGIREEIDRGLSRTLSPGVTLHGHITAVQPLAVSAGPDEITVRVVAIGDAGVTIE